MLVKPRMQIFKLFKWNLRFLKDIIKINFKMVVRRGHCARNPNTYLLFYLLIYSLIIIPPVNFSEHVEETGQTW